MWEGFGELQSKIYWSRAPHFTESPKGVFRGTNPRRDALRSGWWTPRLRRDLQQAVAERELAHAFDRGEVFASIGLLPLVGMLTLQSPGGEGGSGGGAPGEGEGPGGGSGGSGGSGGGGVNPDGPGGMSGQTNTNTGNKLTTLPLVGFASRGNTAAGFTLFHSSVSTFNGTLGHGWSHSYDASITHTVGSSAILRMPDGLQVPYTETAGTFTPPSGWNHGLVRNRNGTWTLTFKNQSKYLFDSQGRLTSTQDRAGNTVTVNRNTSGVVTSITVPDGRSLTLAYNTSNRVSTLTDPLGRVWSFAYNTSGQLTGVSYPSLGGTVYTRSFTYNVGHDILTETDLRGKVWTWTYD